MSSISPSTKACQARYLYYACCAIAHLARCTLHGLLKASPTLILIKACCLLGSMPNEAPDTCNGCNSAQSTDAQEEAKAKESTILESLESQLHIREQPIEIDSGSNNQQLANPGWSANFLTAVLVAQTFKPVAETNVLHLHHCMVRLAFSESDSALFELSILHNSAWVDKRKLSKICLNT